MKEGYIIKSTDLSDEGNFNRLLWQVSETLAEGFRGVIRVRTTGVVEQDTGTVWAEIISVNAADNTPSLRTTTNITGGAAPFNHEH